MVEKSAVAEHEWEEHYPIKWEEAAMLSQTRRHRELLWKEAHHIQMTPTEGCLVS